MRCIGLMRRAATAVQPAVLENRSETMRTVSLAAHRQTLPADMNQLLRGTHRRIVKKKS